MRNPQPGDHSLPGFSPHFSLSLRTTEAPMAVQAGQPPLVVVGSTNFAGPFSPREADPALLLCFPPPSRESRPLPHCRDLFPLLNPTSTQEISLLLAPFTPGLPQHSKYGRVFLVSDAAASLPTNHHPSSSSLAKPGVHCCHCPLQQSWWFSAISTEVGCICQE